MSPFTIRQYGDPVLRQVGEPVKEFGNTLRMLGEAMLVTMHQAKGIGLAAPQIGLSLQLFVAHVNDDENQPILDGKVVHTADIMPLLFANASVKIIAGEAEIYTEGLLILPRHHRRSQTRGSRYRRLPRRRWCPTYFRMSRPARPLRATRVRPLPRRALYRPDAARRSISHGFES